MLILFFKFHKDKAFGRYFLDFNAFYAKYSNELFVYRKIFRIKKGESNADFTFSIIYN
jgi:hypothetical protein